MAFKSASGHSTLQNTPLARIGYHNQIIANGYEADWLPLVVNDSIMDRVTKCNQIVQIQRQSRVGPWRPYEINQQLVADQVAPDAFCFALCMAAYKAIKFDRLDIEAACDRWAEFESGFLVDMWQQLVGAWRRFVLDGMVLEADSRNKGIAAGANCNVNLGGLGTPKLVTGASLARELSYLKRVLIESHRWVDGEMFLLVTPALESVLVDSPYANAMQMGNCVDCSMLKTGELPSQLLGFKTILTNEVNAITDPQTNEQCYYIVAGHKDAYAFVGDVVEGRVMPVTDSFGERYEALATWGGKAIVPDALAVAYWTLG